MHSDLLHRKYMPHGSSYPLPPQSRPVTRSPGPLLKPTGKSLSPDRNLERMIWERWEEAARVIAKAGMETWTGEREGSKWRSGS